MVQRKVSNKLGIQADHVKSEKRLANLKTSSSSQHQDGRNRGGTDMKKKMKKSRSFKLSDFESLRSSSPLKRNTSQPGKPPPPSSSLDVSTTSAAIPQKQLMMKAPDWSPNYMKPTSSFEARKECTQVSSRTIQTGSGCKNPSRRNPKHSKLVSSSGHKPARTLTKTSSLKLVRTLTKTPSFKLTRSSAKKCSQVALCADINAQRATCSSTLKDSKFPSYLTLSPGATESEGTSVMKVCPYSYCSLNGHHHAPLPPLKCFLSARRRLMKTQKSMKLEVLFPHKAKPSSARTKEIGIEQVISDEKPAFQEEDLGSSGISPLVQEGGIDFFIEIYAKDKEGAAETTGSSTEYVDDEKPTYFPEKMDDLNDIMCSVGGGNGTAEHGNGQVAESLSDGSPHSEIDFEDNLDRNIDITTSPEEQKIEDADEDYPPTLAQEETILGYFCNGTDWEEECSVSIELEDDEYISEASDMEWEEGQFSNSHPDNEADDTTQADNESDLNVAYLSEYENPEFHDKFILKPDDTVSNCFEGILADEMLQDVCEEESGSLEEIFGKDNSESDGTYQCLENDETSQVSDSQCCNQVLSIEDALEESTTEEIDRPAKTDEFTGLVIASASMEESIEEPTATSEEEKNAACEAENEILSPDSQLGIHIIDSSQDCSEAEQENTEGVNERCKMINLYHDAAEDGELSRDFVDGSLSSETSDEKFQNSDIVENQNHSKQDHREAEKFKNSSSMDSEEQNDTKMKKCTVAESSIADVDKMEMEDNTEPDAAITSLIVNMTSPETEDEFFHAGINTNQELHNACNNLKGKIRCKRPTTDSAGPRKFNPREPNYLPVEPDPEAEKVDLRHQIMDERKNAEEWMVDYALQQAVSKLAPARNKKVALLVEAFETVKPIPKYETHLRHTSATFAHVRPIQACS